MIWLLILSFGQISGQDSSLSAPPLTVSLDLVSRYVWRGSDIGQSPSIQPCVEYSPGKLTFGVWGAYSLTSADMQEIDFYLFYSPVDWLKIGLTDYLNTYYSLADNSIFDFKNSSTPHLIESGIELSPFKIPLSFSFYSMIYGPDKKLKDPSDSLSIVNAYSSYAEAGYVKEWKDYSLEVFAGFTPFNGFYAGRFAVVNCGISVSRNIKVTEYLNLPVNARLIINPESRNIYFVGGISF